MPVYRPIRERLINLSKPDPSTGCWVWKGALDKDGYGAVKAEGRRRATRAHRASYEVFKGPIPDGLCIDHLCSNHACIHPDHLEVVTRCENTLRGESLFAVNARKTHCPKGHPYDEANTQWRTAAGRRPSRQCRACARAAAKSYRERKAAEA